MSFKTSIYGKYFLLDRIAVGGMAEVFKAKSFGVHGFERLLVIKRILPHLTQDEEFIEMFIDEAKIAVELTHANICQVSDLGKIGENYFIAMEYINGKDLRAILKKCYTAKTSMTIPQAIYVIIEVLKGLDYAHRKVDTITGTPLNLIHRDISPQNIMISYYGEVKIVDFGIAKTESKLHRTQAGVLKGKFGYMSPEQASGFDTDQRTDLFSTGILLFEMLTGRRLFHGDTDFKTLEAIKICNIPTPKRYNPAIPADLEAFLFRSLAKDREERFQSAQEMQVALSRIFFTSFPNFTVNNLSDFLNDLFKPEIQQEQEALRRSMDTLPARDAEGSSSLSEDPVSSSQSKKMRSSASNSTASELIRNPFAKRVKFTLLSNPLFKLMVLASIPIAIFFGIWQILSSTSQEPSKSSTSTTLKTQLMSIESTPPGATIIVEGEAKGVTPLSLQFTPNRVYEIQLQLEGYHKLIDQVLVRPGEDILTFSLKRIEAPRATLFVDSVPQGASINVNGQPTQLITPASVHNLEQGMTYMVVVDMKGFKPSQQNMQLDKDLDEILFKLERLATSVRVNIIPSEAEIFLGDEKKSNLIEGLQQGQTYTFTFKAPGYQTVVRKITPEVSLMDIDIELKRRELPTGNINISAIPWATVIVNDKKVGSTPILDLTLSVGQHKIVFQHPDFGNVTKTITIKQGQNEPIILDFKSP